MGAFSFNPGVISDWDNLLIQKKKEERKKEVLFRKNAAIQELTNTYDADTVTLDGASGRLAAPNVSVDTAETPKYHPTTGEQLPYREKVYDKHALALGAQFGIPPEMVTEEMLYSFAEQQKKFTQSILSAGSANTDTPDVQVTNHGKDVYGRNLVEPVNPNTGVNVVKELNTPENNLDYYSKYNNPQNATYAQKGDDTPEMYRIEQTGEDKYSLHIRGKGKVDYKQTKRPEINSLGSYWDSLTTPFSLETTEGAYDNFSRGELSKEELNNYLEVLQSDPSKPLENGIGEYDTTGGLVEGSSRAFISFERTADNLKRVTSNLAKRAGVITQEEYDETYTKLLERDKAWHTVTNSFSSIEERVHALKIRKDEAMSMFAYMEDLVGNRKEEAGSLLTDSAALMFMLSGKAVGFTASTLDTDLRIADEFEALNGREANTEERTVIVLAAVASTAAEKLGLKGMMGKLPLVNKFINKAIVNSPALGRALGKFFGVVITGTAVEGTSGLLSNLFEHAGARNEGFSIPDGGIPTPSYGENRDAFGLEALGGGIMSTATGTAQAVTTSSDQAVVNDLRRQLSKGAPTTALSIEEETKLNKNIDALDEKLRSSSISDAHRVKLMSKRDELTKQRLEGKPNKDALSEEGRKDLESNIESLETKITTKAESPKGLQSAIKKDTKTVSKLNKQIERLEDAEQTDEVVQLIQEARQEVELLETNIKDSKASLGILNVDDTAKIKPVEGDSLELLKTIPGKLENSDELSIEDFQSLFAQYEGAATDVMHRFVKGETELKEAQQESFRKVNEYAELLEKRVDLTEAKKTIEKSAEKDQYVYSLDHIDEGSAQTLNEILAQGTLTPIETEVVQAKQEVIEAKQGLSNKAKNIADVNEDITGKGSKDFISFNQHLDNVVSGTNALAAQSGLEQFAKHMQGKAETLRAAYDKFLQDGNIAEVEYKGVTYEINNSTETLLEYVEREAAYGQKVVALSKKVSEAAINREADVEVTAAKSQLTLNERLLGKVDTFNKKSPQETVDPINKPEEVVKVQAEAKPTTPEAPKQTQSVEGAAKYTKATSQITKLVKRAEKLDTQVADLNSKTEENSLFPGTLEIPVAEAKAKINTQRTKIRGNFNRIATRFDLDIKDADIKTDQQEEMLYSLLDGAVTLGSKEVEDKIRAISSDYANHKTEVVVEESVDVEALQRLDELQNKPNTEQAKPKAKEEVKVEKTPEKTSQETISPEISTVQLLESGAAYEQGGVAKVYAVGHYSKAQWITIAKKLGVLPDVC